MREISVNAFFVIVLLLAAAWASTSGGQANQRYAASITAVGAEHEQLRGLVGSWESVSSLTLGPGQEALESRGVEIVRPHGDLWITVESSGTLGGERYAGLFTLGYDPRKKAYVGTYVDDRCNHLWVYEGSMSEDGTVLTLETEGPSYTDPAKVSRFRDVYEFTGGDRRVLTSYAQSPDGRWVAFATVSSTRQSPGE